MVGAEKASLGGKTEAGIGKGGGQRGERNPGHREKREEVLRKDQGKVRSGEHDSLLWACPSPLVIFLKIKRGSRIHVDEPSD